MNLAVATRSQYKDETKDIAIDEFNRHYAKDSHQNRYLINKIQNIKVSLHIVGSLIN